MQYNVVLEVYERLAMFRNLPLDSQLFQLFVAIYLLGVTCSVFRVLGSGNIVGVHYFLKTLSICTVLRSTLSDIISDLHDMIPTQNVKLSETSMQPGCGHHSGKTAKQQINETGVQPVVEIKVGGHSFLP